MPEDDYRKVSSRIDADWYPYHQWEWFTQDDICRHFAWVEPPTRQAVSKKLYHDSSEKAPAFLEKKNRAYRIIDQTLQLMDWQGADPNKTVPLKFPFGLEKYCCIYPKSIVIVAAPKNEGKTGFLYNFIKLNMHEFDLDLFNSETGKEQMFQRFQPLDIPVPSPFKVYERYDNFADVVRPKAISVIDYLDFNSEVYLVGAEIDAIFRKLTTGVALIALQAPPPTVTYERGIKKVRYRDLAYGGGFTAKRAILYISMAANKLKLVYVKTPKNPKVNPNNMSWSFAWQEDGIHFKDIQRYYGEQEGF